MKPRSVHSPEYQLLVSKIRETRVNSGLTQRQVAANLDKPASYVGKVETSERELNVIELMDYCIALNTDPVAFFQELHQVVTEFRRSSSTDK